MMYENNINMVSRGCQLCQKGKWLCIFLTYQCNAGCHFCPAPFKDDRIYSVFGNNKEEILEYLKINDFEGISFSGGDPFMVYDRLLEWLVYFKKHLPFYYFWVYTNGLAIDASKLQQIAGEGMDEIRFNIAATGYLLPEIWDKINIARNHFSFVSVEIPSIRSDYPLLEKALELMDETGVDYLNLHDYILSETDLESRNEISESFKLNLSDNLKYAVSSLRNTKDIIELSKRRKYIFLINHCSMKQKENQMLQRRKKMAEIFSDKEYDTILDNGTICNYYYLPDDFSEDTLNEIRRNPELLVKYKSYLISMENLEDYIESRNIILKVIYLPKMEIDQDKKIILTKYKS